MSDITTISVGALGTNCYLITDDEGTGVLIDPGAEPKKLESILNRKQVALRAILLTHIHFDHLMAVPALLEKHPVPLYIPALELPGLSDSQRNGGYLIRREISIPAETAVPVEEGTRVTTAGLSFTVWHTPGHTAGSSCYLLEGADTLFSGDTLFYEEVGRTDLPTGSYPQMLETLRRLAAYPGDLRVLPGHDQETTLEHERRHNSYMREAVKGD